MEHGGLFTINEFAKFSRTTKDTLLHYDRIGLLKPEARGDNKYRYYSTNLLATVNMIRTLQRLGMTLDEIKELKDNRSPELAEGIFLKQIEKIDEKIDEWVRSRKLLLTLLKTIKEAVGVEEDVIKIQFQPAEAIVLGSLNDYSRGKDAYDALTGFYNEISEKYPDMDLNYPVWAVFSGERIKNGDWVWPDRYYFYNPDGFDRKPAALYAVGYTRGGYGQSDGLYKKLLKYVYDNGFEICGNVYEEYPHNELSVSDEENYLIRVTAAVHEISAADSSYGARTD
ncbi:MAG: MerR family transcriptional regulator [Defluviitaleaceae bacterium]|nr:MerR family transcriptional regulator [Defluviitaleaceae bacterium]